MRGQQTPVRPRNIIHDVFHFNEYHLNNVIVEPKQIAWFCRNGRYYANEMISTNNTRQVESQPFIRSNGLKIKHLANNP